jgi:CheY-like chemotaxis protein
MNDTVARKAVLVIDDDPEFRRLIKTFADLWNVPVLEAEDCRTGLKILEREHYRIKMVLLDYFMPGMEPAKCARAILAKAGQYIRVILVTAAPDPRARAVEMEINRWIAKPFESSTLKSLLTNGESKS